MQGEVEDAGWPDLAQVQKECQRGAVRSTWPLLWCPCSWDVDIASRRTLEDPIETRRHPLGVIVVVIAVSAIVFAG